MKDGAGMAQRRTKGLSGAVPAMSSTCGDGESAGWPCDHGEGRTNDADAVAYTIAVVEEVELDFCVSGARLIMMSSRGEVGILSGMGYALLSVGLQSASLLASSTASRSSEPIPPSQTGRRHTS